MEKRKTIILKMAAIWLGIFLFLTFFSSTIYNLNLPNVAVGFASEGIIYSSNRAEGILDFTENQNLYADHDGRLRINLREGDRVAPGDLLYSIYVDIENLHDRLESEQNRLERTQLNRTAAQNQLQALRPGISLPAAQAPPDTTRFDHEENRLTVEIARAEEEYETQQSLLDAGVITREEFARTENHLEDLRRNRQRNQDERAQVLEAHQRTQQRTAEENRVSQEQNQRAYTAERTRLQNEINLHNFDENEIRRQIERLNKQIEEGGVIRVYSENHVIVREIPQEDGMHINRNQLIMRLGLLDGNQYSVTVYFPESMGFLPVGTHVRVDIRSFREFGLSGEIVRMTPSQGRLRTEVSFKTEMSVSGGEGVVVTVDQFSELFGHVLPNTAIRQDDFGSFVLYISRERNTLLGYSYVARQMRIFMFEEGRGERQSAIHMFGELEGPVIIQSDRPVTFGDRVRLVADQ